MASSCGAGPSSRWAASACASTRLDGRGLGGDRTHAVEAEHKRRRGGRSPPARRRGCSPGAPPTRSRPTPALRPRRPAARHGHRARRPRLGLGRPAAAPRAGGRPRPARAPAPRHGGHPGPRAQRPRDHRGERCARSAGSSARRSTCGASAPTCISRSTRRRGRRRGGRAVRCASRAASCCASCTRASAARSPPATPTTQEKWPELLRHLDAHHGRRFGINARVVRVRPDRAGRARSSSSRARCYSACTSASTSPTDAFASPNSIAVCAS